MIALYNLESILDDIPTIFLAGPTPRRAEVSSWRPDALRIIETLGFTGADIIPEDRGFENRTDFDYAGQIDWERACLTAASIVVFWVPRHLVDMPAFTTNIEFGFVSERDQPFVLGYPKDAPKMRYLAHLAAWRQRPVFHTLNDTLAYACQFIKDTHRS